MNNFDAFYSHYVDSLRRNRINIDYSYRCPLECPLCLRQLDNIKETLSESDDISSDTLIKFLEFSNFLMLCGQISDPIYHANFLDHLKIMCSYSNTKIQIHTNGSGKKLSWWQQAFEMSKQNATWIFGLDGTDQETANVYRINTDFDEVFQVMKLGSSIGCKIQWQFIVFQHNEDQLNQVKVLAQEIGVTLRIIKSSRWAAEFSAKNKVHPPSDQWVSKSPYQPMIYIDHKTVD
jgi:hypothetical protein